MSHYNAFPSEDLEAAADREFGPMVSAMNPHFDVQAFDDAMCIAIASSSFDVMGPETRANNSHSDQAFDTFVDEFPLASAEPGTFALRPQFDPSRRAQTFENGEWQPSLSIPSTAVGFTMESQEYSCSDDLRIPTFQCITALDDTQIELRNASDHSKFNWLGTTHANSTSMSLNERPGDPTSESRTAPFKPIQPAPAGIARRDAVERFIDTQFEKKKRMRKNKKQPGANNQFGRSGVLSCYQCRKRKSKCVYISEWLPCEFCRSRDVTAPCFKIRGPKTAARHQPSRPIPTADSAVISGEDALLLSYAYSGCTHSGRTVRFRILAAQYGSAISCRSLRHAVLALSAFILPQEQFSERAEYHKQQAESCLLQKLRHPNTIEEADVFAVVLLAEVAYSRGPTNRSELVKHVNGCMSIMQFLSEKSYKVTSDTFVVSAPFNVEEFAFNLMNARILVGTRPSTVHLRRTTFRQRVRFWDVIHQFSSPLALWPKSSSVAAYDFLQTTLMFAFNCLCRVAVDEQRKSSERLLCVEDCLKNIEIWFQDAEFQDTLQMMQKWDSAANGFALLLIQCVHLAMMVLKSTSIMEGLECPETSYRATQLLARIVARIVGEVGEEFVDRPYAFGIVLIGLTLPGEAVEEDGAFLCNELNGLGQPLLAEAMRNFWENRTLDEVVEVVRSLGFVW